MLTPANELDIDNRVKCLLANWIAFDPESGYYLYRSAGRRKGNRPAKYYLSRGFITESAKLIFASDDCNAVTKARLLLAELRKVLDIEAEHGKN